MNIQNDPLSSLVPAPPGLPSNPRYSKNSWKQSLGRICKHHILDININTLDGKLLVFFYFVWEWYEVVALFVSVEWHFPHRLKLWAPGRFQLLQVTLKSSAPCQTDWPDRTSLLLQTSQCRLWKSQISEDFQVSLIRTKIKLVGLNIWDVNSSPPQPAGKTLFFLLTVHNTTNKCINFAI